MTRRILIVEDEPTLLFALQDYLDHAGYAVDTASRLDEAERLLAHVSYDVVVTDLRLTPVTATEGLHVIQRARERSLSPRIVVLTGCGSAGMEKSARRLGADRFLRKPVPLAVVAKTISEVLNINEVYA